MTKEEALNVAGQCRATASHPLAYNISVDGGSGLLRELLIDAAKVIEALAQPEQGPVVCKHEWFSTGAMALGECRCIKCGVWNATSPQRKPLTDDEILKTLRPTVWAHVEEASRDFMLADARAIEAAHGIKGQDHETNHT